MESLIDKAKSIRRKEARMNFTDEHIDLAIAWAKHEIGQKQFCSVLGITSGRYLAYIAEIFREAVWRGRVK